MISNYLNVKGIKIGFSENKPVVTSELIKQVELINQLAIDTIIIDSTCFNHNDDVLSFLYQLKVCNNPVRIIFIAFNRLILAKVAMLGIYDIILYEKNIDLKNAFDELLVRVNNLCDIKEYLDFDSIMQKDQGGSNTKVILWLSYDVKCYLTSTILSFMRVNKLSDCCMVEWSGMTNPLVNIIGNETMVTTKDFNLEQYDYFNTSIYVNGDEKINVTDFLTLLLNVKSQYRECHIDLGQLDKLSDELLTELMLRVDQIVVIDTMSLYRKMNPEYINQVELVNSYDINKLCVNQRDLHIEDYLLDDHRVDLVVSKLFSELVKESVKEPGINIFINKILLFIKKLFK